MFFIMLLSYLYNYLTERTIDIKIFDMYIIGSTGNEKQCYITDHNDVKYHISNELFDKHLLNKNTSGKTFNVTYYGIDFVDVGLYRKIRDIELINS